MDGITIGVIGGSGLGTLLGTGGEKRVVETPFGPPSDAIFETQWEGVRVLLLSRHGPGHTIPPSRIPSRANIFALKSLGCTHMLASGAVGSLRENFKPRELVVPDQTIDKTVARPGTFYERAAVHVEMAEPFCPVLRKVILAAAKDGGVGASVHERGCYVCMEGPAFSTRAESVRHRLWGGDLIGMTALPEAKLAREAELPYAMIALVTDYDCWKAHAVGADAQSLLAEIIGNLQAASTSAMALIRATLRQIAANPEALANCPASDALKQAIWSDKSKIAPEEIDRLSPLWGRYFR